MVNQASMVSRENVVLLVHKVLLGREAYLESLAEMWVHVLDLPALASTLQMGDLGSKYAVRVTKPPSSAWCIKGLARLHPHIRWRRLLSLLYLLLPVGHVSVSLATEQETVLPVDLQNNAGLVDLSWVLPPPGPLPSWKLSLSLMRFKLSGKQAVCSSSSLGTNCTTLFFSRVTLARMAHLDVMDPQEAK